jgi:hypothetical protein
LLTPTRSSVTECPEPTPVNTDAPDPVPYLRTACDVVVPPEVVAELRDITQYQDIHPAAAPNVLTARGHYTVEDPYERENTPDSSPTFGLDDGETDGIVLANALDVDGFLTSSARRTSHRFTPCCRARGSSRCRGSSSTTLGTAI